MTVPRSHEPSLLRLALGACLVGAQELRRAEREWESRDDGALMPGLVIPPDKIRWRWAAIGLVFDAPARTKEAAARVMPRLRLASERVAGWAAPLTRSKLLRPARARALKLRDRSRAELLAWTQRGWLEEQRSRILAAHAFHAATESAVTRIASAAEVREVVVEQGASLAAELVDGAQARFAEADDRVEGLLRSLRRRRRKEPGHRVPWGPRLRHRHA